MTELERLQKEYKALRPTWIKDCESRLEQFKKMRELNLSYSAHEEYSIEAQLKAMREHDDDVKNFLCALLDGHRNVPPKLRLITKEKGR